MKKNYKTRSRSKWRLQVSMMCCRLLKYNNVSQLLEILNNNSIENLISMTETLALSDRLKELETLLKNNMRSPSVKFQKKNLT